MDDPQTYVYRPGFGRVLAVATGVVCLIAAGSVVVQDGFGELLRTLPWLLLVSGLCWALFWRPEVRVDDGGVRLVNVLRTVDLPWPSITVVDTKWALTVSTRYGKYTAWAAPTSSRYSGREMSPGDVDGMPASTFGPGRTIRPGDSPTAPSGKAAMAIRLRLEQLQQAGYLDDPRLEHDVAPVRWHGTELAVAALLVVWGVLGTVL